MFNLPSDPECSIDLKPCNDISAWGFATLHPFETLQWLAAKATCPSCGVKTLFRQSHFIISNIKINMIYKV